MAKKEPTITSLVKRAADIKLFFERRKVLPGTHGGGRGPWFGGMTAEKGIRPVKTPSEQVTWQIAESPRGERRKPGARRN
jgi:hypothetical protein